MKSRPVVSSIQAEYERYKALADGAMAQLGDADLSAAGPASNSIAVICWHVSGNLQSRFTDFLSSDGEKPWRRREEEFQSRTATRDELAEKWAKGWAVLFDTLATLDDTHLDRTVTIREQPTTVVEALHRSLAHTSYHVGQIVYVAKALRAGDWHHLSIPPGGSAAYNAAPGMERPASHAASINDRVRRD